VAVGVAVAPDDHPVVHTLLELHGAVGLDVDGRVAGRGDALDVVPRTEDRPGDAGVVLLDPGDEAVLAGAVNQCEVESGNAAGGLSGKEDAMGPVGGAGAVDGRGG